MQLEDTSASQAGAAQGMQADRQLLQLAAVLDQARAMRKTLTYLQAAEAIHVQPPHRIHQVTELLERLMEHDAKAGHSLRAALVISRARAGQPADGFYHKARALGLFDGREPKQFHQHCLEELFA